MIHIRKLPNYVFICLILGLRPLLGPSNCRFKVGCTQFAVNKFKEESFFKAFWAATKRVFACNPFNRDIA